MAQSKLFEFDFQDLKKGILLVVATTLLTLLYQTLTTTPIVFDFKQIGINLLIAVVGYVKMVLATNNRNEIFKKDK